jgi:tRNA-specific 2-thiouridylase
LGADFVALQDIIARKTKSKDGNDLSINSSADTNKDQSYFLCQLSQEQLAKSLFPIEN